MKDPEPTVSKEKLGPQYLPAQLLHASLALRIPGNLDQSWRVRQQEAQLPHRHAARQGAPDDRSHGSVVAGEEGGGRYGAQQG